MRAALGFILLAAAAGLLVGATRALTVEQIATNEVQREADLIANLLGGLPDPTAAARLCRTEVRGYASTIKLLVLPTELNQTDRTIESVRVLSHSETPGIGDFIELNKSPWIRGFDGLKSAGQPDATTALWLETLDAVTGATITRRAIIEGVASACPFEAPKGSDPLFGPGLDSQ